MAPVVPSRFSQPPLDARPLDGLLAVAAALRTGPDLEPTLDAVAESDRRGRSASPPSPSTSTGRRSTTSRPSPSTATRRPAATLLGVALAGRGVGAADRRALRAPRRVLHPRRRVRLGRSTRRSPTSPTSRRPTTRTPGAPRTRCSSRCARSAGVVLGVLSRRRAALAAAARPTATSTCSSASPPRPAWRSSPPSTPQAARQPPRGRPAAAARLQPPHHRAHARRHRRRGLRGHPRRARLRARRRCCCATGDRLRPGRRGELARTACPRGDFDLDELDGLLREDALTRGLRPAHPRGGARAHAASACTASTRRAATAAARTAGTTTGCSSRCTTRTAACSGVIWPEDPRRPAAPDPGAAAHAARVRQPAASALEAAAARERLAPPRRARPADRACATAATSTAPIDAAIAAAGDEGVALVVADADAFKRVNDELGYEIGRRGPAAARPALHRATPPARRLRARGSAARSSRSCCPRADAGRRAAGRRGAAPRRGRRDRRAVGPDPVGRPRRHRRGRRATPTPCCAPPPARCSSPSGSAATASSSTTRSRSSRCWPRSTARTRAAPTSCPPSCCWPRRSTCATPARPRHSQTVGRYAEAIARAARASTAERGRARARSPGVLHDIGKLAVSDAILHKPGALEPDEWAEVRRHAEVGARICSPRRAAGHRRLGARPPRALGRRRLPARRSPATAIPLEARILSRRRRLRGDDRRAAVPQPAPLDAGGRAQQELRDGAGTQFDPARGRRVPRPLLDAS